MDRMSRENKSRPIWTPILFFGLLGMLLFLYLFIIYKGLNSPSAMEHATIARQLARGEGFTTKVIRPFGWHEFEANQRPFSLLAQRDITQPPLPSLVLAPVFKVFTNYWEFKEGSSIYFMDRVVSLVSVSFYLGALVFVWMSLFRIFDARVAGWSMVCMIASNSYWELATQGLGHMMTLFFFCVAIFFVLMGFQREGQTRFMGYYLVAGVAFSFMVMCNYYTVLIVVGLSVGLAIIGRYRMAAIWTLLPSLSALGAIGFLYYQISGEPFGTHIGTLKSSLAFSSDVLVFRNFDDISQNVNLQFLYRKLGNAMSDMLVNMFSYVGGVVPAVVFFFASLHPFKNPVTSRLRWVLLATFLLVFAGMSFLDVKDSVMDDRQLIYLFGPIFTGFGVAFLYVLWTRWGNMGNTWLGEHGLILIAFLITFLPLMATLPTNIQLGLLVKGQMSHYPDYVPERMQRLKTMVEPGETLFSDLPWATAWYADRSSIWWPIQMKHFLQMKARAEQRQVKVAGLYLSAQASKVERMSDLFQDQHVNREWAPFIYRGFAGAFGVDTLTHVEFPFKTSIPLLGKQLHGGDSYMFESVFFTDQIQ